MSQLVARASNTVRNKNVAMVALCLAFMGWFAYDGFKGWPEKNDRVVDSMKSAISAGRLDPVYKADLDTWRGWDNETDEGRKRIDEIVTRHNVEGWHSPLSMLIQRWLVLALGLAVVGSVWWLMRCQARRVIADEETVSPSRDVIIPWDKITIVDNTRWKKSGIVDITYLDEAGQPRQAKFDDYEVDREPLLAILDKLAEKAQKAEFLPKDESPPTEPAPPPNA